MKNLALTTLLLAGIGECAAQSGRPISYGLRTQPFALMLRDSVGPLDVVIGVQVDTLCQMGMKRIINEFPGSCAPMALHFVGPQTELELMKLKKFKCKVEEIRLVFQCEVNDD